MSITITQSQMRELEQRGLERFERYMVAHLYRFFPEHCGALELDGVRRAITAAISKAAAYGFVSERDVCAFIDLMFAFGEEFDTDTEFPSFRMILNDAAIGDPSRRMDRLWEEVHASLGELQKTAGNP